MDAIGCLLAEGDRVTEALSAFDAALAIHGDLPEAHFHKAELLHRAGRSGEAVPHWQMYLRFDSRGPWGEIAANRLMDQGRWVNWSEELRSKCSPHSACNHLCSSAGPRICSPTTLNSPTTVTTLSRLARSGSPLAVVGAGLVAVVALEAGVSPAIAAVLLCVKAGGRDMANGIWLWRRDPRSTNRAVIGLIYMSYAGWRIVFSSVLLAVVLAFATSSVEHWLRQNGWRIPPAQGDFQNVMQALGITCGSMLLVSSLVSAILTLAAGFLRVPVWLSSQVTSWRKRDEFPPSPMAKTPPRHTSTILCW